MANEQIHLGRSPGTQWTPVTRGVHRRSEADDVLAAELRCWLAVLRPDTVLNGLTAAAVRGWWLPPMPDDLPVFATSVATRNNSTRPGLVLSRTGTPPAAETIDGLRLASVGETILSCCRVLDVLDATTVIECALHTKAITHDELLELTTRRRRGVRRLRAALRWVDGRAESIWEVLLRVLHESSGVETVPQFEIHDNTGLFIARGDLWVKGSAALHEYDGGDHLKKARQRKDLARARRLTRVHWERRGYTSHEVVLTPVAVLRDADETIGREHDPARIRPWLELLRSSLFTPAGMHAFRTRLGEAVEAVEAEASSD